MFVGEHNHTIDAKGRLIVPAKFREALGAKPVISRGLDGCLTLYPEKEWDLFLVRISELPLITNKKARAFSRQLTAGAAVCEPDSQGRILVPSKLREIAGLEKEVVLVGNMNKIEIWNKKLWDEMSEEFDMDAMAEELSEMGISL